MKNFTYRVGILLFLALASAARADHIDISFGPSMNGATNPKLASLGYEKDYTAATVLLNCGAMFEDETNLYCSGTAGIRVETAGGLFSRISFGPAIVGHTDDRLSSIFEFNTQAAIGMTQSGRDIGIVYNHFSNAGITPPNYGRDFIGLLIEIGI